MTPLEICKASYRVGMKISTPYGTETVLTKDDIDGIFIYPTGSIYTTDGLYMLFDISDGEYAVILPKESKQLTYLLVKQGEDYKLYGEDDSCIATTMKSPYQRLSKQNCDEIFGAVNIEKLIEESYQKHRVSDTKYSINEQIQRSGGFSIGYEEGFNKAMELQKDKLFTETDIRKAYQKGEEDSYTQGGLTKQKEDDYIQSLQQTTEIEVRLAMGCSLLNGCSEPEIECTCEPIPSLDENGCLILWVLNTKNK
jgi:hypothetical protein